MVRRSRLDNGLRIVSEQMPGVASTSLGIWVENGSRYEREEQRGISHFLEHLFFKGTERRTATQIAEEIDALGGVLNAFTDKECTCYYARVLGEHAETALDVLSDVFLHSRFDADEIERERGVVIQEILQGQDAADEYVHELFDLHYWPGHPLSFPIYGNAETVGRLGRHDFLALIESRYRPNRIVVAGAGAVEHDRLVEWAAQSFGGLSGSAPLDDGGLPSFRNGLFTFERDLEQVHVCLGTEGVARTSEDRFAGLVLSTVLGGGMSSRLFQEVRERRGKAYSVGSFQNSYRDTGYLAVYAGTSAEWVQEVIDVVFTELRSVARDGLRSDEIVRAKNQLKGNVLLGLETSESRMTRAARSEIYFGRDVPTDEVLASIDAVRTEDVGDLARRTIRSDAVGVAILGDLNGRELDAAFSL